MTKYSFFAGCDISKSFFDVSYYEGEPKYLGQFANDMDGFKEMVKQLKAVTKEPKSSWFFCFENTGVYSKALLEWLISQQIDCKEENALKISKSKGLKRGKNDRVDSKIICQYGFEKRDSLKPTQLPKPVIVKLKKLLSRRDFLIRQKQALVVSLKDQKQGLDPSLYKLFKGHNDEMLNLYREKIKELDNEIERTIKEDEQMKKNDQLAQSVVGVGPVISAYMIALTNNFTTFESGRKFASYSGIAPFLYNQSGNKQGKSRVSHIANKKMKSLLSMGVNAAVMFDKELKTYYERKLTEGKEKGVVLNAVKNKLVHRVFSVIQRQTPYVKMMTYA